MHDRDTDRASLLCERIYGLLLAAYPRRFRDAYGSQMAQALSDLVAGGAAKRGICVDRQALGVRVARSEGIGDCAKK